jgi:hypothetical protein
MFVSKWDVIEQVIERCVAFLMYPGICVIENGFVSVCIDLHRFALSGWLDFWARL